MISVVADELLYGSRPGWIPDTSPNGGGAWTNPTGDSGFEAARALRRNTAPRAERGLHVLRQALVAMVRAAAYLTVATVLLDASAAPQWLGDLAGFVDENPPFDQLPARFLHVLVAAVIALVVIEIADAVVRVLLAWRQLRVFLARRYWLA